MLTGPQLQKLVNQSYGFYVLHIVLWCFIFVGSSIKISGTVFNLQCQHKYMVEMDMFNVQRAVPPNIGKPELRLIFSACCHKVLYICVKFPKNILNGFQLIERI